MKNEGIELKIIEVGKEHFNRGFFQYQKKRLEAATATIEALTKREEFSEEFLMVTANQMENLQTYFDLFRKWTEDKNGYLLLPRADKDFRLLGSEIRLYLVHRVLPKERPEYYTEILEAARKRFGEFLALAGIFERTTGGFRNKRPTKIEIVKFNNSLLR